MAPVLDLELGSLCFGVQLLLDSKASEAVHHAILAVASSQRASTRSFDKQLDQATSITSEHLARDETEARHGTFAMPKALLLWKDLCLTPIEDWFSMTPHVLHHTCQSTSLLEHWLLLSRLHCAASLITPLGGSDIGSFPPLPQSTVDGKVHPALSQLGQSLWMLEKTLFLLLYDGRLSNGPGVPNAQDWRIQWHEIQQWYSRRIDEMRQIFEVTGDEILHFEQQDNIEFPYVVFSNACATVANVAHHTASFMLLQHKPRLIKPVAQTSSSISSMWHAHRVIGIVSAAAGAGIWDPFITATLAYCSRKLSNATQIRSVVDTMKLIQMRSGLKLENAICDLEELAKDS